MVKAIADEFMGKGTPGSRNFWRKRRDGKCDRCGKEHSDMRRSWRSGQPEMVRKVTCNACVERMAYNKLYGDKAGDKK